MRLSLEVLIARDVSEDVRVDDGPILRLLDEPRDRDDVSH